MLDWQNKKMWSLRRAYSEGLFAGEGECSQIHVQLVNDSTAAYSLSIGNVQGIIRELSMTKIVVVNQLLIIVACVASVSVGFGSKQRQRNGIVGVFAAQKNGREPKNDEEGTEGNACRQIPGF